MSRWTSMAVVLGLSGCPSSTEVGPSGSGTASESSASSSGATGAGTSASTAGNSASTDTTTTTDGTSTTDVGDTGSTAAGSSDDGSTGGTVGVSAGSTGQGSTGDTGGGANPHVDNCEAQALPEMDPPVCSVNGGGNVTVLFENNCNSTDVRIMEVTASCTEFEQQTISAGNNWSLSTAPGTRFRIRDLTDDDLLHDVITPPGDDATIYVIPP